MLKNKYGATIRIFRDEEDEGYIAQADAIYNPKPVLDGGKSNLIVNAFGESIAEALFELGQAMELALEVYEEDAP